ncbi:MAG: hypothetical protein EZS28_011905 [Streblomastix strix]|uniref:Uncharacterized protein n=1 Tax=Streblomastix strix TaxID=222440 RepID=A0A5J4WE06_9EUKA|nr:MAG: hypothetical protein EZS28_011905 [Streblomastix strix]
MAMGPVNQKQGKYSSMSDSINRYSTDRRKTQLSDLPKNLKQIMEDDADNYTQLEVKYMDSKGCEVYFDERDGEVSVRFRGQAKATVRENGHLEPNTDEGLHYNFWEFESPEEMKIWTACIPADAAKIKSSLLNEAMIPVKRKRDESQSVGNINSNSLQAWIQQQKQQYSKFNSLADQKVSQDLATTFESVLRKQALKIDMLIYTLEPVAKQKLFEEISWDGANIIFPKPEVGPLLKEEQPGYAWKSLESAVAVTQEIAMLINDAAKNETNNLVGKMLKVFEVSLESVADSQIERESRLEGVYQGPQTEDVLSLQTKERLKRKTEKQINIGGRKFWNTFTRYNSLNRRRKRLNKKIFGFKPRGRFNREFKPKSFKFNNYSNHNDDKNFPQLPGSQSNSNHFIQHQTSTSHTSVTSIISKQRIPVKRIFTPKFDQLGARIQIKFNSQTFLIELNQPEISIEYIPSNVRDQLNAVCQDIQSFDPANRVDES